MKSSSEKQDSKPEGKKAVESEAKETFYATYGTATLTSIGSLAFCIPQNEKVTEFYDRIENRLFNVRNCRNIEGVFRDLPLYDPPIDPLLLIRARAAGLDIDSILKDLYAPLPNYRFNFTLQKALELTAELKALGSALLTTLEKQDAEELTLLRSSHEIAMLKVVRDTRQKQLDEATANIVAMRQSEETILERLSQYQKLLGKPGITKGQDGLPVVEQSSSLAVATDPIGGVSGLGLTRKEVDQLVLTAISHVHTQAANAGHILAGLLSLIPNTWGGNAMVAGVTFGGANLGSAATAIAKSIEMVAAEGNYLANQMGTFGGYERRQDEWVHQSRLALAELKQIEKQIIAAEIRKAIAEHELSNHDTQIENAQEVDEFMHSKFTNQQLYRWMSSQIAEVYFRTYQLALDQARRVERTYQFELGVNNSTTPFVQIGRWDSLKRGLLAGEQLHHDLRRMESAYLERNHREFELTKHVSLALLDPLALVMLRETGRCSLQLPEELFDLDYPGHYFRRIKSVSLTLPCVAGPYMTICCTLRLSKNTVRINTDDGDNGYPRNTDAKGLPTDDDRFLERAIPVTAIATSTGQNDSGLFELNFRDERYLPFEGAGVVSSWSLELFNDSAADFGKSLRQFDYGSIPDAILHIKYTARDEVGDFKDRAVAHLRDYLKKSGTTPSFRMFNLRQEFPTEWARFLKPITSGNVFELEMRTNLFPFRDKEKTLKVNTLFLLARCTNVGINKYDYTVVMEPPFPTPDPQAADHKMTLTPTTQYGDLYFSKKGDDTNPLKLLLPLTGPPIKWKLRMTQEGGGDLQEVPVKKVMEVEDLVLVLGYESEP